MRIFDGSDAGDSDRRLLYTNMNRSVARRATLHAEGAKVAVFGDTVNSDSGLLFTSNLSIPDSRSCLSPDSDALSKVQIK